MPSSPRLEPLVVNADAFGLTAGVSQSIVELFNVGGISTTTVMAAAPGALELLAQFRDELPHNGVGVHLQASGAGTPLTEGASLTSEEGRFKSAKEARSAQPRELHQEWRAQIEAVIKCLGRKPSHLDVHHGLYIHKGFRPVYISLANEYGLPVRGGDPGTVDSMQKTGVLGSWTVVGEWTGTETGPSGLFDALDVHADSSRVEVIAHPAFVDDELRATTSMANVRRSDHDALQAIGESIGWASRGWQLTTHLGLGQLPQRRSTRR